MSADTFGLRLPVDSSRKTISSLNSLIQGLFHTPEWSQRHLDLDLHSFNLQSTYITFDHETETGHESSSRSSGESTTSTSEASETRSMWFNDSPRNSFVELADDNASVPTLASHSHVSSPTHHNRSLYFGSEIVSALLSGIHSHSSSISHTHSGPSLVINPSDVGCDHSAQSSDMDTSLSDCLDDELLSSPLDSFAAICWSSAVRTDEHHAVVAEQEPLAKEEEEEVKTEESFDFYNPLQYDDYDDDSMGEEYGYPPGMDILSIEYQPTPTSEVAPWMHVPKKALSILNFPEDYTFLLKNYNRDVAGPPLSSQKTTFVPAIAGKCRKLMKSF